MTLAINLCKDTFWWEEKGCYNECHINITDTSTLKWDEMSETSCPLSWSLKNIYVKIYIYLHIYFLSWSLKYIDIKINIKNLNEKNFRFVYHCWLHCKICSNKLSATTLHQDKINTSVPKELKNFFCII